MTGLSELLTPAPRRLRLRRQIRHFIRYRQWVRKGDVIAEYRDGPVIIRKNK